MVAIREPTIGKFDQGFKLDLAWMLLLLFEGVGLQGLVQIGAFFVIEVGVMIGLKELR